MAVTIVSEAKYHHSYYQGTPAMTRKAFLAAEERFTNHFKFSSTSSSFEEIKEDQQEVSIEALKVLCGGAGVTHLAIFLGLSNQGGMVYGFLAVKATKAGSRWNYDAAIGATPSHVLRDGELQSTNAMEWSNFHNNYRSLVKVKRLESSDFEGLKACDGRCLVLGWDEEILAMYKATTARRNPGANCSLVVESVSVKHNICDGGNAGYRHGTAFYVQRKYWFFAKRLILDGDTVSFYRIDLGDRAVDYGNLCPPRCHYFERDCSMG